MNVKYTFQAILHPIRWYKTYKLIKSFQREDLKLSGEYKEIVVEEEEGYRRVCVTH